LVFAKVDGELWEFRTKIAPLGKIADATRKTVPPRKIFVENSKV
jgi:hypothetical protein